MSSPLATLAYLHQALSEPAYAMVSGSGLSLTISAEVAPPVGEVALPPLVGNTGPAGNAQFALRLQTTGLLTSPSQLPTDLTNTSADIGRYWLISQTDGDDVISSAAYIWFGSEYRILRFGTQGPPGPYPVINPTVTLLDADDNSVINVTGTGSAADPYQFAMQLAMPEGPAGPPAPLGTFLDVEYDSPPTIGQMLAYNGETVTVGMQTLPVWENTDVGDIVPRPYTLPSTAFSSYVGISLASAVTVGQFAVPPQPFAWKACVWGQVAVTGLELSLSPLLIGVEVRLGSPTGTLVSRGFGNSLGGIVSLIPHTSSPGSPTTQMTPSNGVALVSANHTGTDGTLYVNLLNDGLVDIIDFNADNSQLFVMAVPSSTEGSLFGMGGLSTKVTLSAIAVTHGS